MAKANDTAVADREIVLSRLLDAPRELVWNAWTDPKQVVKWWGPNGFETTIDEMDVRPGGVWKHTFTGPDGSKYPNKSVFTEVVKYEKISYSHGGGKVGGPGAHFTSTWTFETVGKKTRLTIHMVFDSAADKELVVREYGAVEGGKQTLGRLADLLESEAAKDRQMVISRVVDAAPDLVWQGVDRRRTPVEMVGAERIHHDHEENRREARRRLAVHHARPRRHRLSEPDHVHRSDETGPARVLA